MRANYGSKVDLSTTICPWQRVCSFSSKGGFLISIFLFGLLISGLLAGLGGDMEKEIGESGLDREDTKLAEEIGEHEQRRCLLHS